LDVFNSSSPLSYELSSGNIRYGADMIQWQETTDEEVYVFFSKQSETANPFYVTVTAINSAGLYTTRMWTVFLTEGYTFLIT
jgi:hypothetical protein